MGEAGKTRACQDALEIGWRENMSAATLVVFNPKAGKFGNDRLTSRILRLLDDAGVEHEIVQAGAVSARHLSGKQRIIACGGDGTVHRLLPLVLKAGIPLGLVPLGTGNVLARELGLPRRLDDALSIALGTSLKDLRLGRCGARPFLLMAGAGVDGYLAGQVKTRLKRRFGLLAFWIVGLTRFRRYRLPTFSIEFEGGERITGTEAIVANGRLYGGGLCLTPDGDLTKPVFEVCIFQSPNHLRYLRYLTSAYLGRHLKLPDVLHRKARIVRIEGDTAIPVQLDGEPCGGLPVVVETMDRRLQVFVPSAD